MPETYTAASDLAQMKAATAITLAAKHGRGYIHHMGLNALHDSNGGQTPTSPASPESGSPCIPCTSPAGARWTGRTSWCDRKQRMWLKVSMQGQAYGLTCTLPHTEPEQGNDQAQLFQRRLTGHQATIGTCLPSGAALARKSWVMTSYLYPPKDDCKHHALAPAGHRGGGRATAATGKIDSYYK